MDTSSFLISKKNQNRIHPELSCISGFGDGAFASSKSNASNSGSDNFQSCVSRDFAATVSAVQSPVDGITANLLQLDSAFPSEEDVKDIDCPSAGFASIEEALTDIRDGKACFSDFLFWTQMYYLLTSYTIANRIDFFFKPACYTQCNCIIRY